MINFSQEVLMLNPREDSYTLYMVMQVYMCHPIGYTPGTKDPKRGNVKRPIFAHLCTFNIWSLTNPVMANYKWWFILPYLKVTIEVILTSWQIVTFFDNIQITSRDSQKCIVWKNTPFSKIWSNFYLNATFCCQVIRDFCFTSWRHKSDVTINH